MTTMKRLMVAGTAAALLFGSDKGWAQTGRWTLTTLTNAPSARLYHAAVWSGSRMIVWGGYNGSHLLSTGSRYDPLTDSWTTTSMGAKFFEDGQVEIKGRAKTVIGDRISPEAKKFLKDRFEEKGFELDFVQDIKDQQWNKLIVNAVANPISALIRRRNDGVLVQGLEATVEDVVVECIKVARLEGLELNKDSTLKFARSIIFKNSANVNSMLQDVLKGKRTEIDSINGYVVRLARKHGIRVPVNEVLYGLVKALEEGDPDK